MVLHSRESRYPPSWTGSAALKLRSFFYLFWSFMLRSSFLCIHFIILLWRRIRFHFVCDVWDIKSFTRRDSGRGENKSACADEVHPESLCLTFGVHFRIGCIMNNLCQHLYHYLLFSGDFACYSLRVDGGKEFLVVFGAFHSVLYEGHGFHGRHLGYMVACMPHTCENAFILQ